MQKSFVLNYEADMRSEQVEGFDLIGHMAYQRRNLVISQLQALKNAFMAKKESKFEISKIF